MVNNVTVAIARFVKKDNADVKQVVLLPSPTNDGSLLVHRLTCVEDMRDMAFGPLKASHLSAAQKTVVSNFVDSVTTDRVPVNSNTALLNFYLEIEKRVTAAPATLYSFSPHESSLNVAMLKSIKDAFPLTHVQSLKTRPKKYWSDIALAGKETAVAANTAAVRIHRLCS
jgi:hypothetical protein